MIKIQGVHHIVLTVKDLQRSKDFYQKVTELELTYEDKESVEFWQDNFRLWLQTDRDHKPKVQVFDRNQIGLDHFAFLVPTLKDLIAIEKRLRSLGIEMEEAGITDDGYPGTKAIFIQDPDGMKVEFHL